MRGGPPIETLNDTNPELHRFPISDLFFGVELYTSTNSYA
jgi:hypothetical protein